MASYEQFESKLLEGFTKEIVFIELKAEKEWRVNGFVWPHQVPIPIYVKDLAEHIQLNDIENIPVVALLKGLIYALGVTDEAFKYWETYVAFIKAMDENLYLSVVSDGLKYAEAENYLEAILYFKAAILLNTTSEDAWYNRGRAYYDLAKKTDKESFFNGAVYNFNKTLELNDSIGMAHYFLGYCYYGKKQYHLAYETWKKAIARTSDFEIKEEVLDAMQRIEDQVTFERGVEWLLSGRVDEGLVLLKSIEEDHDEWWELMFYIGLGLRFQEHYEDALGYFLKAQTLNTGDVKTLNELGICFLAMGDIEQAKAKYKEAMRLSPENPELICNMGIVFLNEGDLFTAKEHFELAKDLAPEDDVVQRWLAHVAQLDERNVL